MRLPAPKKIYDYLDEDGDDTRKPAAKPALFVDSPPPQEMGVRPKAAEEIDNSKIRLAKRKVDNDHDDYSPAPHQEMDEQDCVAGHDLDDLDDGGTNDTVFVKNDEAGGMERRVRTAHQQTSFEKNHCRKDSSIGAEVGEKLLLEMQRLNSALERLEREMRY